MELEFFDSLLFRNNFDRDDTSKVMD